MTSKCTLIYDASCPICVNYVKILKRKISMAQLNFVSSDGKLNEFKFITEDGTEFQGKDAIAKMANRFPIIMDYFWMLPEKFRVTGLQVAYKAGSVVRNVLKKASGCGCGK